MNTCERIDLCSHIHMRTHIRRVCHAAVSHKSEEKRKKEMLHSTLLTSVIIIKLLYKSLFLSREERKKSDILNLKPAQKHYGKTLCIPLVIFYKMWYLECYICIMGKHPALLHTTWALGSSAIFAHALSIQRGKMWYTIHSWTEHYFDWMKVSYEIYEGSKLYEQNF